MHFTYTHAPTNTNYTLDMSAPIDISIPLREGMDTVNCFWAPPLSISPVRAGEFVGDMQEGGLLNFKNVQLNPHGNGTHTECVGHISPDGYTLNQCLKQFVFPAWLITLYPEKQENGDRVVKKEQIKTALEGMPKGTKALILRTMPNDDLKEITNYSGANPPYIDVAATEHLVAQGIEHFLLDLPSVDREEDEGALASHKCFWNYPSKTPRTHCTITELIYVRNEIKDGFYLLNIQITSLELDASPSKPVLYKFLSF